MPPEFLSQLRCCCITLLCTRLVSGDENPLLRWLSSAGEVGMGDDDVAGDESPISCESQLLSASKGELSGLSTV
jgi:hypothetical protein